MDIISKRNESNLFFDVHKTEMKYFSECNSTPSFVLLNANRHLFDANNELDSLALKQNTDK